MACGGESGRFFNLQGGEGAGEGRGEVGGGDFNPRTVKVGKSLIL